MIAAIIPAVACGNTLPLLLPEAVVQGRDFPATERVQYSRTSALLLANLNALVLDFIARQKIQGQHLNFYIVEQLPILPKATLTKHFGGKTAEQIIREDVLALTYTAHDLDAFARDIGHTGPPFRWDPEDRLRRRARLDALFFILYGLDQDDAEYVMDTFPILREQEIAAHGTFRTKTLVLNMMAALKAGHPEAQVAG